MLHHIVIGLFLSAPAFTMDLGEARFESGLFQYLLTDDAREEVNQDEAIAAFFRDHSLPREYEWKFARKLSSGSHTHYRYRLHYRGREVLHRTLDLHIDNATNAIQYARSSWRFPFSLGTPPKNLQSNIQRAKKTVRGAFSLKRSEVAYKVKPIVWIPRNGIGARYALEVHATQQSPTSVRHQIIDEETGKVLATFPWYRKVSNKVFEVHADAESSTPVSKTLPGLTSTTQLRDDDGHIHVKREQDATTATSHERVDVDPTVVHADDGGWRNLDSDPQTDYDYTCDGALASSCPNQAFDAVNAYYHAKGFRDRLEGYFSTLSATPNLDLDPLDITVNVMSVDLDSVADGDGRDEANNAFYASGLTDTAGNSRSGLFFLRPADVSTASTTACGTSPATSRFWNVAREGLIVAHEYQHYVTDKIADLVFGSQESGNSNNYPNVGDHLHEGYSDYLAASHITIASGRTTTIVGERAFKECEEIQRDISQIKVFTDQTSTTTADNFADSHTGGWSWASGLWSLRETLGAETTDLLAVKSLFFLSTRPGFVEAVESLVLADQANNGGVNIGTIRDTFYNTVKFMAGGGSIGTSGSDGVYAVGFESCLGVHHRKASPAALGSLFLLWFGTTFFLGRRIRRWRK